MEPDPLVRALKAQLRAESLGRRDALRPEERIEKSLALASHGASLIQPDAGAIVSGFLPIRSEVDLKPLMSLLGQRGIRLCVPVILDRQTIVFREFSEDTPLVPVGFGTLGPGEDAAVMDPDLMLVPLAAFDNRGHRIGYGAGHYDRAIHRLHQKGLRPGLIGIAFDCQEVASVPDEPHDIRLDAVLTESGLRPFGEQSP